MYKRGTDNVNRNNFVNLYHNSNNISNNIFEVNDKYVRWGNTKYSRGTQQITKYKNFNPPTSIMRGGIIPIINDTYGLGVSTLYNELSDFGGGLKVTENKIVGALREFFEESLGIFGDISLSEIPEDCIVVYDDYMFIIFLPIYGNVNLYYSEKYLQQLDRTADPKKEEVSNIIWLTFEGMKQCILGYGPYKIYNLIIPAIKEYIYNTEANTYSL